MVQLTRSGIRMARALRAKLAQLGFPADSKLLADTERIVNRFGKDVLRISGPAREQAIKEAHAAGGSRAARRVLASAAEGLEQLPLTRREIVSAGRLVERRFGPVDNLVFTRGFEPHEIRFTADVFHLGALSRYDGTIDMAHKTVGRTFIDRISDYSPLHPKDWDKASGILREAFGRRGLPLKGWKFEKTAVADILRYSTEMPGGKFEVGRVHLRTGRIKPLRPWTGF